MPKFGSTRTVFLVGKWAIKVPGCYGAGGGWTHFLLGLIANMQEAALSKTGWPELCPVVFHVPGGFLTVMLRADPLPREAFFELDVNSWSNRGAYVVPVEDKHDSFGSLAGKIVAVDYGN